MSQETIDSFRGKVARIGRFFCLHRRRLGRELERAYVAIKEENNCIAKTLEKNRKFQRELEVKVKACEEATIQLEGEKNLMEKQFIPLQERLEFVSIALAAKRDEQNKAYNEFTRLLEIEFMEFANEESSLAEEALAVRKLDHVRDELNLIMSYPSILTKKIIAVGGGFSSGKSAFINSLIDDKEIQLPEGIKPVTAIPAYVVSGEENRISGYSSRGGVFPIEKEAFTKINHDFMNSFVFNIKDIVPYLSIETPIRNGQIDSICFIDTPGYNPAATGFSAEDVDVSSEYIKDAECLMWLVPAKAGTVPLSDLQFLDALDSKRQRKLFILISRADDVPLSDLENVMDAVEVVLADNYVDYEGIAAYSSYQPQEYPYRKKTLDQFLAENNINGDRLGKINELIDEVFDMYGEAIEGEIANKKDISKELKSLSIDLLQIGVESDDVEWEERIEKLKSNFKKNVEEKHQKLCEEIRAKLKNAVSDVIDSIY